MTAAIATTARPGSTRPGTRTASGSRGAARQAPMKAPTIPAAMPTRGTIRIASEIRAVGPLDGHEDVRPRELRREADGGDQNARHRAEDERASARRDRQRDALDDQRLDEVEREVGGGLAEDRADDQRQRAADDEVVEQRDERGSTPCVDAGGDERATGREGEHDRLEQEPELRDAEVELGLEGREADQKAAGDAGEAGLVDRGHGAGGERAVIGLVALAAALDHEGGHAEQRQAGAPDQHQVRRAPEGDVLAEDPVPHVVERKAHERERAAREQHDAADRGVPVAGYADGRSARLAVRQDDREEAGGEDAEEAGEDEVVGGVGERALVAALPDVQGDVPVHAEDGDDQGDRGDVAGQDGPRGGAGDLAHALRGAAQPGDAARAVRPADPDEGGREQDRSPGRADDLADGCAAGGRGGGGLAHLGGLLAWFRCLRIAITLSWRNVTSFDDTYLGVRSLV